MKEKRKGKCTRKKVKEEGKLKKIERKGEAQDINIRAMRGKMRCVGETGYKEGKKDGDES